MESSNWFVFVNTVRHRDLNYTYYNWEGEAPIIHALHGFMGSGRDYSLLAPFLKNRLVAWDLIGHGDSDAPLETEFYTLEGQLEFLRDTLPKKSVLMGYSMGGRLALQFACRYPEHLCGVIVIGGTAGIVENHDRESRKGWDHWMASRLEEIGMKSFLEKWNSLPIIQSQEKIEPSHRSEMLETRKNQSERGLSNSLRHFGSGTMPDCWSKLPKMKLPVLLIVGEQDSKYKEIALQMLNLIDHSSMGVIPSAGHCAHLENPEACSILIKKWISVVGL